MTRAACDRYLTPSPGAMKFLLEAALRLCNYQDRDDLLAALRSLYAADNSGLMVYVIREGEHGPVKIGQTTGDPRERLATLQCGNSSELRGLAAWDALEGEERFLHELFAEHHIRGEWFRPDPFVLDLAASEGGTFFDPHAFDLDPPYEDDPA